MLRFTLSLALMCGAVPAFAQSEKEVNCGYQAEVIAAIQDARGRLVRESKVEQRILEADPTWPARYSKMIPTAAQWVYSLPRKDAKNLDLAGIWKEGCLQLPDDVLGLSE